MLLQISSIMTLLLLLTLCAHAQETIIMASREHVNVKTGEMIEVKIQTTNEKLIAMLEKSSPGGVWNIETLGKFIVSSKLTQNENNPDYYDVTGLLVPVSMITKGQSLETANYGKISLLNIEVKDDGLKAESIKIISTDVEMPKWQIILIYGALSLIVYAITRFGYKRHQIATKERKWRKKLSEMVNSGCDRQSVEIYNTFLRENDLSKYVNDKHVYNFQNAIEKIMYKREWTKEELAEASSLMKKTIETSSL